MLYVMSDETKAHFAKPDVQAWMRERPGAWFGLSLTGATRALGESEQEFSFGSGSRGYLIGRKGVWNSMLQNGVAYADESGFPLWPASELDALIAASTPVELNTVQPLGGTVSDEDAAIIGARPYVDLTKCFGFKLPNLPPLPLFSLPDSYPVKSGAELDEFARNEWNAERNDGETDDAFRARLLRGPQLKGGSSVAYDAYAIHRERESSGALDASARAKYDREREARLARSDDIVATFGRPYNGLRLEERKREEAEAPPWSVDDVDYEVTG